MGLCFLFFPLTTFFFSCCACYFFFMAILCLATFWQIQLYNHMMPRTGHCIIIDWEESVWEGRERCYTGLTWRHLCKGLGREIASVKCYIGLYITTGHNVGNSVTFWLQQPQAVLFPLFTFFFTKIKGREVFKWYVIQPNSIPRVWALQCCYNMNDH